VRSVEIVDCGDLAPIDRPNKSPSANVPSSVRYVPRNVARSAGEPGVTDMIKTPLGPHPVELALEVLDVVVYPSARTSMVR
jgi:hypothetical protein